MRDLDSLTEDDIHKCLQHLSSETFDIPANASNLSTNEPPKKAVNKHYRKASVLIPFVRIDHEWHLVFICRAISEKDRHSGQVAFPGGKSEETDKSDIATALRETHEEIGVEQHDINVLGKLGSHYSISNFEITPVVATIPWPCTFTLEPSEVSRTFTIPLSWLADQKNYEIKNRIYENDNKEIPVVYFNEFEGELLWGATARMVLSLIERLLAK